MLDAADRPTGALPHRMPNAWLEQDLEMRVGCSHPGGAIPFHVFQQGYPAMVSAATFWDAKKRRFRVPKHTDLADVDFSLDSAGFTAMLGFKRKGPQPGMAGIYPWTLSDYMGLVTELHPSWWAQPDTCTEPEIASNQAEVTRRVNITATLLEGTLRGVYAWQNEMARTGWSERAIHNELPPPVPVLQGWSVSDYLRSLDNLMAVWSRWEPWVACPTLIGLGSVCRRSLDHPTHGLWAILAGLEGRLPPGARVHVFGVKGAALSKLKMMDWIASADSMAFDFAARIKAREARISNTTTHRSQEMDKWMANARNRMAARAGDQFVLNFASTTA